MRHLMRLNLTFILLLTSLLLRGQSFTYPIIKTTGQTLSDFVPNSWTKIDSAFGDLNKDGVKDAAIIIQSRDSVSLVNSLGDTVLTQPRILLILFKNPIASNFYLKEQSNSFILRNDNPEREDPFQEVKVENGILKISFQLFYSIGSWYITNSTYKFRFQNNQFYLIGADYSSFQRATHDSQEYSYNFLTKKRSLTKGNDKRNKTTWKPLNLNGLKTFETFPQPFTWDIEEEVSL